MTSPADVLSGDVNMKHAFAALTWTMYVVAAFIGGATNYHFAHIEQYYELGLALVMESTVAAFIMTSVLQDQMIDERAKKDAEEENVF